MANKKVNTSNNELGMAYYANLDNGYSANYNSTNTSTKNNTDHKAIQTAFFNKHIQDIANETIRLGRKLTDKELEDLLGDYDMAWFRDDHYDDLYNEWFTDNYDTLLGPNAETNNVDLAIKKFTEAMSKSGVTNQQLDIPALGTLGADYQALLNAQNSASDIAYQTAMEELSRAENDMYRTLGMSQRQMERDIAKRRQQALKSGMSTAQLAAQEQQNLLAAQTGATQIAQQYADQRYGTINQFAGARAQNYANALQSQIGWNQQAMMANQNANNTWANTMANAYAQFYAADANLKALKES